MREIEVKAKIENLNQIAKKLEKLGCELSKEIMQNDIMYEKPDKIDSFNKINPDFVAIRIRDEGRRTLFTVKRNASGELDSIENEIEIGDLKEMDLALKAMGYIPIVKVNKKRRKCQYGEYEVCLDEVDDLGSFIEVEKIIGNKDEVDGEQVQKELFAFLESIGVTKNQQEFHGYDTLMYEKNYKK